MSCFPCFGSKNTEDEQSEVPVAQVIDTTPTTAPVVNNPSNQSTDGVSNGPNAVENNGSRTFTFRELLMATKNFKQECLIGEGGFGKLYKGKLQSGEVVAVKHLDRNGTQGNKEFLVEVLILTLLHHPNLVKLIGYCADGEQRLIVYEYMSFGSLDTHLHGITDEKKPLDWQTRMKIASGVAQGLEYLHEKANPPIFYRDLKPVNILLDEDHNARLSGYGLAKLVNGDTKTHASPRVMGTYGYCAPEYERQGELTVKSDVYSFGVILLELITGRRALDTTRPKEEQTLVSWAQPLFRDQKKYPDMADPLLEGRFPQKSLNQAIGMVAMCLQEEPSVRPLMSDVVSMLSFLEVTPPEEAKPASLEAAPPESKVDEHDSEDEKDSSSSGDESDENSVGSQNDDEDHPKDQNENIPNGSQNFEKQGSSSQHEVEANPGNKAHNSLSSDDESDSSSVSSENNDGDHPKDQMEYIPNQSQKFEKQGSGSQHEMEANPENKSRNSNERECSSSIS